MKKDRAVTDWPDQKRAPRGPGGPASGKDPAYRYVGQRCPVRDARAKATGEALYTEDLKMERLVHGKMLFSTIPHGTVLRIDTSEARSMDGVLCVMTCLDAPSRLFNSGMRFVGHDVRRDERIFHRQVRFVGDRIGAVVAETQEIAERAAQRVRVEYEERPAVFDLERALEDGAPALHEGGNLVGEVVLEAGDAEGAIRRSRYVFRGDYRVPAVHHFAMEPHASIADWDGEELRIWTSGQNIFAFRLILSDLFALPPERIRIIKPVVGGGFGGKLEAILEPAAAFFAMKLCRPVRFVYDRRECVVSTRTRHAASVRVKTGFDEDGRLQGIGFSVLANAGAYASATMNVLGGMSSKSMLLYRTPHISFRGRGVYTNTPVAGAMRGYGSPQLFTGLELHMDEVARALGMDPVELRLQNLVSPGDPHPRGGSLGNARIRDCLLRGAGKIGWKGRNPPASGGGSRRAIGLACGVHGNGIAPRFDDCTGTSLELDPSGTITLYTGTQDIGGGLVTTLTRIVGEVLRIDPSELRVVESDTGRTPFDVGTFASRGTWVAGEGARTTAGLLRDRLIQTAAEMLGEDPAALHYGEGPSVVSVRSGAQVTLPEIGAFAKSRPDQGIRVSHTHRSQANPGSYGAHFADVEVDPETGKVTVHQIVAVHDVGRAINPMMVEGQIEGGVQMGLGYALTEKVLVDPVTGRVRNARAGRYRVFRADEMPAVLVDLVEEGEEPGPFGAKSIGEAATVPTAAAVINGINAALGTVIRELPATPEAVLESLREIQWPGEGR